MSVHFSSKTDEWATPQDLFNELDAKWGPFDVDVCADRSNAKVGIFWDRSTDGLEQSWRGLKCWMNPPYGKEIGRWINKAANGGAQRVVALLPARTDTRWFHDHIYQNPKARTFFIKGRIKFGDSKNSAPFPSMVVVFDNI